MMKRVIALGLAVLLMFGLIGCSPSDDGETRLKILPMLDEGTTKNDLANTDNFVLQAETDAPLFYINPDTTHIRVEVKATGQKWTSGQKREDDSNEFDVLTVHYMDEKGKAQPSIGSFEECVKQGQYQVSQVNDTTFKVEYSLGQVVKEYVFPSSLLPDRYEKFLAQAAEEDQA